MNYSASLAVKAIDYYQSNISHKKKFRCAHGALHKGLTCSAYSRVRVIKRGLLLGLVDTTRRLLNCWKASKEIKKNNKFLTNSEQGKQDKKNNENVDFCTKTYLLGEAACCIASILPW